MQIQHSYIMIVSFVHSYNNCRVTLGLEMCYLLHSHYVYSYILSSYLDFTQYISCLTVTHIYKGSDTNIFQIYTGCTSRGCIMIYHQEPGIYHHISPGKIVSSHRHTKSKIAAINLLIIYIVDLKTFTCGIEIIIF